MPKILLIEDNPGDARLIKELLKSSEDIANRFVATHVQRLSKAIELLSDEHDIDIILSDMTLPDASGMEALERLSAVASGIPIVFMTGTNDDRLIARVIAEGAQDYLVKGRFSGEILTRSLLYAIARKRSQNEMNEIMMKYQADQQRMATLANEKKQLIKLNQSKDEFVSIASHQLRTPATAVKQCISMIINGYFGAVPEQQLKYLKAAYASNERELNVIDELLITAQLDAEAVNLKKETVDVGEMVRRYAADMEPVIMLRDQAIQCQIDDGLMAAIDLKEFKLLIENLIENASKYSPNQSLISLTAYKQFHKVVIEVTDQGVGIDKKDQKKIFDKFTRVDNEISDTVTGTGLGLYWVKRIVKLHAGTISLRSAPGLGSTFTVRLPA